MDEEGIDEDVKISEMYEGKIEKMSEEVEKFVVEGDMRSEIRMRIKRMMDIGWYRGLSNSSGIKVRGKSKKKKESKSKGKRKKIKK